MLHRGPAQVQVAVFQPQRLIHVRVFVDVEGRRPGLVENPSARQRRPRSRPVGRLGLVKPGGPACTMPLIWTTYSLRAAFSTS